MHGELIVSNTALASPTIHLMLKVQTLGVHKRFFSVKISHTQLGVCSAPEKLQFCCDQHPFNSPCNSKHDCGLKTDFKYFHIFILFQMGMLCSTSYNPTVFPLQV